MPKCDFNKLQSNFIEITLWHECSPENLLHIFRTPFYKNTSKGLLQYPSKYSCIWDIKLVSVI